MEDNGKSRRYFVDLEGSVGAGRSVAALIATRRCRECVEVDGASLTGDPQENIARIAEQCSTTTDYLLPDTPLREAIFRVILAGGNEPKTSEEISETLSAQWSSNPSRDVSNRVIEKLLEHGQSYCIAALPEPEAESDEADDSGSPAEEPGDETS